MRQMQELSIMLGSAASSILIRDLSAHPIPTAAEVRQLLDYLPDYHPKKLAMAFIAIQGLRPREVVDLTWDNLIENQNHKGYISMWHFVYKPKNSILKNGNIRNTYKKLKKPIFSEWLSDQIVGYKKFYPRCQFNKIFPFSTPDVLNRLFTDLRKEKKFAFLLDKVLHTLKGTDNKTIYRVHPYSLRRFCMSYHYYTTFKRDIVALSKAFGHTKIETTFDHYVYPAESIGLKNPNDPQVSTMDGFLSIKSPGQTILPMFEMELNKQIRAILALGQRQIGDFL